LSMLRQHGGPMMQSEIANKIPIDAEDLAEALKSMETEGLIHRQWEPKESTYLISTVDREIEDNRSKAETNGICK